MTVVAWDCASDEYREMAYGRMAEDIAMLLAALKTISEEGDELGGAWCMAHAGAALNHYEASIKTPGPSPNRALAP